MDFLDRLRMLSRNKGLENNMQLSKASGVPYTTLDNFYRNGYENVKLSTLKKLAVCLGCTIEYLVNGSPDSEEVSPKALELAKAIESLDPLDQQLVESVVRIASKRPKSMHVVPVIGTVDATGEIETKYAALMEQKELNLGTKEST